MKQFKLFKYTIAAWSMILLCGCLFLSACKAAAPPKPSVQIPAAYRGTSESGLPQTDASASSKVTFGELYWGDFLTDPVLQDLIRTALAQNYDVRLAAERILEAQARLGIARSAQYPQVGGQANFQAGKASTVGLQPVPPGYPVTSHATTVGLQASYEMDFWGRLRNSTQAARADLLATEEARNTVLMTLVSEIAAGYFTLRELDLELDICKKTLDSRQDSYRLVKAREEGGVATMLDVEQAQGLVLAARKAKTLTEQRIAQQENYLSFLLGKNPDAIPRGKPLAEQLKVPEVPAGLPSALLENRPDIRAVEQQLIAANARIEVARAAYFPQIILTGSAGTLSKELSNLFTGTANTWSFVPQLTQPIFTAGKLSSQVKVSESQQRQAVIQYERTVRQAFREVSDSLIGYAKQKQARKQQEELTATLQDQSRLSHLRYVGGVTSYLEVLDTERQYFESELDLARSGLNEILQLIQLYKALGGGWQAN
jgi:NodT family efflux transporter outer membrane factor (OMF) lipoprotein